MKKLNRIGSLLLVVLILISDFLLWHQQKAR